MADAGVRKSKKSSGESMNVQNWPPLEGLGRHPALAALAEGQADAEAIEAFLAGQEFPLAEPGTLTFAWHGQAEHVHLVRWIHGGADRQPFVQLAGTDLWLLRVPVEDGGRFEYKLAVGQHGQRAAGRRPAATRRGRATRSAKTRWRAPAATSGRNGACRAGRRRGGSRRLSVASRAFGEARDVGVYLPAGHDPERAYPLVVVHDGGDFVTYADLPVVLDNLIDAGEIPPVIAALVQTRDRLGEYSGGREHSAFLVGDLLPALAARLRISEAPAERVLLGASLGAVASLVTAFRHPGVFGGLVLKSGSFILDERKLSAAAASGLPPHRPADARAPPRAAAAADAGFRLDRRARGARRREPGARKLLARTRG